MLGSLISGIAGLIGGKYNAKKQEEFAKNSITWKAEDAERAGISKIFAMGAPTHSFSPVSTGDFSDLGKSIDNKMGQNTAGATTTSQPGRAVGLAGELARAQLDGVKIDNDIKRAELASKVAISSQPGVGRIDDANTTIPGQGDAAVKLKREIAPRSLNAPNRSYGVSPEVDAYRTSHGYSMEVPQELGEAQESQPLSAAQWFIRNKIMPSFDTARRTFPYPAPPGSYWSFNPVFGEYTLKKLKGKQLERFYPYP